MSYFKYIGRENFLNNFNPISNLILIGTSWVWNSMCLLFGSVRRFGPFSGFAFRTDHSPSAHGTSAFWVILNICLWGIFWTVRTVIVLLNGRMSVFSSTVISNTSLQHCRKRDAQMDLLYIYTFRDSMHDDCWNHVPCYVYEQRLSKR